MSPLSFDRLFDSHCHLDYLERGQPAEDPINAPEKAIAGKNPGDVLQRALENGVGWILNPSVNPSNFQAVLQLAERYENVYAALAVHPTDVTETLNYPDWLSQIETALKNPKVKAIGETGLDYYWDLTHKDLQQQCLRQLLALALRHDLPVIIHDREAHEDIHAIVSEFPGVRGVMHCFSGDAAFAEQMMALGFYISFAGNVTFKSAKTLQDAATVVPLNRLLVETDSPFLAPVPHRGKSNEPAYVRLVAEKIADLKQLPLGTIISATTENAKRLFAIDTL